MKQVSLTPKLQGRLQKAVGEGVDTSKHAVFEAIGLNTLPVRKEHPLYKGAQHSRAYLEQMAKEVNKESRPLQIMHDGEQLPIGRIFYGEVFDTPTGDSELRTLFWVDPEQDKTIAGINNGTIDQVSVSTLAAAVQCSECDWNFLGDDSDFFDNIYGGVCANDHKIGEKGVHAKMNKLGQWYEMSLVGRGGATGARICTPANSALTADFRLAASGERISPLALSLSSKDLEPPKMDIKELTAALTASIDAKFTELKDSLKPAAPAAPAAPAVDPKIDERFAALEASIAALKPKDPEQKPKAAILTEGTPENEFAKKVLVMSGDVEAKLPDDPKAAYDLLTEKLTALKAAPKPGGNSQEAASGTGDDQPTRKVASSVFKANR